jgi:hypothetical protein
MKLHVGVPEMRGKMARFPFSLLELHVKPTMLSPKGLKAARVERPDLAFVLRAPLDFPLESPADGLGLLAEPLKAITAEGIVLPTGPRFGPTKENLKALCRAAELCRGSARFVAWEPHGVFEITEAARWAAEADVVYVSDWTREPAITSPIGYTRLRALGRSGGISQHNVDRLLELLPDFEEAFVIVEGDGAARLKKELTGALAGAGGDSDDLDDDFDDTDDFGEDEEG